MGQMTSKNNSLLKLSENSGEPENFLLSECVRKRIKAPDMIIRDNWPAQTFGLFTGDGGVGKTHFTLQLLYAIASGQDIPGTPFKIHTKRPVVYITQEDEAKFIIGELFHLYPNLARERTVKKRIRVISTAIKGRHLSLTDADSASYIVKHVPQGGVFTLDSWSTFLTSNENDATQVLQNEIKMLRAIMNHRQATPFLIHHRPKRNSQTGHQAASRGTTALPQNCRFHIMLESAGTGVGFRSRRYHEGLCPTQCLCCLMRTAGFSFRES
jgi:RecA-family ATPase